MLDKLVKRIEELGKQIDQSAANYNAMLGAMTELRNLYHEAIKAAPVVEALDPALTPVVDTIEAVVNAVE